MFHYKLCFKQAFDLLFKKKIHPRPPLSHDSHLKHTKKDTNTEKKKRKTVSINERTLNNVHGWLILQTFQINLLIFKLYIQYIYTVTFKFLFTSFLLFRTGFKVICNPRAEYVLMAVWKCRLVIWWGIKYFNNRLIKKVWNIHKKTTF